MRIPQKLLVTIAGTAAFVNHALAQEKGGDIAAVLAKAGASITAGKCDVAIQTLEEALRGSPTNARALNLLGMARVCMHQDSLALPSFNEAIAADDALADAYANRGKLYLRAGGGVSYKLAIEDFKMAAHLEPNNAEHQVGLAQALFAIREYEDADKAAGQAIALDPKNAGGWSIRGQILSRQGRYQEALPLLNEALRLDPKNVTALLTRATVRERLGDAAGAKADAAEAARLREAAVR